LGQALKCFLELGKILKLNMMRQNISRGSDLEKSEKINVKLEFKRRDYNYFTRKTEVSSSFLNCQSSISGNKEQNHCFTVFS
jgi:hypothetical protein